ncbi:MAG TPA: NADH-ubiquinone oxidoreductase-F iron-sulfur binding region domain-containing protein [Solirubrobacteraceae bacterium]
MSPERGLPRLLRGIEDGRTLSLAQHLRVHGALDTSGRHAGARLLDAIEDSGLRGRGGAHVSSALKLRAVAGRRRRAVVVANGSESEPASRKDAVLLTRTPHLVIDGAVVAATAVGADEAVLYVKRSDPRLWAAVQRAVGERQSAAGREPALRIVAAPSSYVSGQETAAIAHLNGRPALPTTVPPRPFERGVDGRPTLVSNVETLAHMALIARHGADWFRAVGSPTQPGSVLVTLGGAVARPGVYEIAFASRMADLLRAAGRVSERPQALLVGGYGGAWLDAQHLQDLTLSEGDPLLAAGSIGAGVLWVLGEGSCGVWESARVLDYLAEQSAGQCGPCLYGLRAIADSFDLVARGAREDQRARLTRWGADVTARGACRHPDGAARFLASALEVFAREIDGHRAGRCAGVRAPSMPLATVARAAA